MIDKLKREFSILNQPTGGLIYANRFTVVVSILMGIMDVALLIYQYINGGDALYITIYSDSGAYDELDYIFVVSAIVIGGIVWAYNSELDGRIYTAIIFAMLIAVTQILFRSIQVYSVTFNYIIIMLTIIYAKPMLTIIVGVIVQALGAVNYWTIQTLSELPQTNPNAMIVSEENKEFFFNTTLFFLPMTIIVATLVSIVIRQLFSHMKTYSDTQARVESSNAAAASIQKQIIGTTSIDTTAKQNVSIYPFLTPADYVAGDFYDYYSIDRYHVCFMVADVSGKGMAAGLFMVRAKEILKASAKDHLDPAQLINRANEELCINNTECMFATTWIGILDLRTGVVKYCNAGHTVPIFISNNRAIMLDDISGPMIGLFPDKKYKSFSVTLGEGDRILLYTDGVTDQQISDDKRYGDKGLITYIKNNTDKDNLCEGVYEDMNIGKKSQFDDITMLQINFKKKKGNTSRLKKEIHRSCYLAAAPKSIRIVRSIIMDELKEAGVDKTIITTFYVACEEMMTNIIKYAYGSTENDGGFSIEFWGEDDYIAVVLKDSGVAFNPFLYDNTVYANKVDAITDGGRGIKIFKDMMDEYSYHRHNDTNVITARKYI